MKAVVGDSKTGGFHIRGIIRERNHWNLFVFFSRSSMALDLDGE